MFNRPVSFFANSARLAACVVLAAGLSGCGQRTQPLDQVVFSQEPLKQIQLNVRTFKQLPDEQLKLLLAYLGANEKAKLEGKPHSDTEGKPLVQVLQEAGTWKIGMADFIEKTKAISIALGKLVLVSPASKLIENNDESVIKATKSQILKITYQLTNQSTKVVTGVAGVVKYYWPDGRLAATIPLTFDAKIEPGKTVSLYGHEPILVGSKADKDMVNFANAPLNGLRFEVTTQAIRLDGGEIVSVPVL